MPRKTFGDPPFPPVVKVDTVSPLSIEQLEETLKSRSEGVTLCVRSIDGHQNRGGYFFHLKPVNVEPLECEVFNFEKIFVAKLPLDKVVCFINHCAGLAFDEWAFQFCQSVVNFRLDPE